MNTNPSERFWSKVEKTEDCWTWTGLRNRGGYGVFRIDGRNKLAHRISYELFMGPFDGSLFVCHHCDNPSCVRPGNLFLGTNIDNMRDMTEKGRYPRGNNHYMHRNPSLAARGEKHGMAKLTDGDVISIRETYELQKTPMGILSQRFGVSKRMIRNIISGRNWRHLL